MENNRYCTQCGSLLKEGARFCSECGAPVKQEKDKISSSAIYETYEENQTANSPENVEEEIKSQAQWEEKKKTDSTRSSSTSTYQSSTPSNNSTTSRDEKRKDFIYGAIIGSVMAFLLSGALVHPDRILPSILVGAITGGLINRFNIF